MRLLLVLLSFVFCPRLPIGLFSSRMENMGKWLKYDSLDRTENIFNSEIKIKDGNLAKKLKIRSYGYHTYSYLQKSLSYYAYSQN